MIDRYMGSHASLADYVQDMTEEATAIPQGLRFYIDYQAMARDAEMSGDLLPSARPMTWCMYLPGGDISCLLPLSSAGRGWNHL